jgi:sugar phosphate isomerase/epimerase
MFKPALQLYSLRREAEKNPEEVLLQVPALGYQSIELAAKYGWSNEKWKEMLSKLELKVVGAHAMISELEANFDELIEYYRQVGNPRVIVPWLEEKHRSPEGFRTLAKQMNEWGRRVKDAGFSFCYHNHDFEFQKLSDGSLGYDILLENTDPGLVGLEVDTYWVQSTGRDALEFVKKHESRVAVIHAKDLSATEKADCAVGKGVVNFKEIVPLAVKNNWPVVVEYEGENAIQVVRESAEYLSKF